MSDIIQDGVYPELAAINVLAIDIDAMRNATCFSFSWMEGFRRTSGISIWLHLRQGKALLRLADGYATAPPKWEQSNASGKPDPDFPEHTRVTVLG
jgi:hypothetical protein